MITGRVIDGAPVGYLPVSGQSWVATIDTGFNGDLELPEALAPFLKPEYFGRGVSLPAGALSIEEDHFFVNFPFDGTTVRALTTFVPGDQILIGTRLIAAYRLTVDFARLTVILELSRDVES